ncbi:MAG: PIN domain-containing protein [Candidatus Shapirobacteria bacterium]
MRILVLDTNVFVRFLIKDVPRQFIQTEKIFQQIEAGKIQAKVSILVIDELIWVLENYYQVKREVFLDQLLYLFALKNLKVLETKKSLIVKILEKMKNNKIDFTDFYLAAVVPINQIFSFDKDFKKLT